MRLLGALVLAASLLTAGAAPASGEGGAPKEGAIYFRDAKGVYRPATPDEIRSMANGGFIKNADDSYRAATPTEVKDAAAGIKEDKLGFLGLKRYDLGIYTLIVFGLLLFILSKFAWPNISAGLKKREDTIQAARDDALRARQEAEDSRAKLQKDLAEAADKIRAMLDEARRDADALRAKEREAGAVDAAAERERAKREIQAAKDVALDDIYKQAVDLATMLSAKTLARQISADDHRRLLDESLAEFKQTVRSA